jgi:hypothetical protein
MWPVRWKPALHAGLASVIPAENPHEDHVAKYSAWHHLAAAILQVCMVHVNVNSHERAQETSQRGSLLGALE